MTRFIPWLIVAAAAGLALWRRTRPARRRRRPTARRTAWPSLPAALRGDTLLIAAREVRQRARGRLFRLATLIMLAGVAAAIVIPTIGKSGGSVTRVGIVGALPAGERAIVVSAGAAAGTTARLQPEPDAQAARAALRAGRIDLAILDGRALLTRQAIRTTDTSATARLARASATALAEERAYAAAGLSPAQVARITHPAPLPLRSLEPAGGHEPLQGAAVIGVILLFILLSQYNGWTLMGVMEEKASRVVEVLLATVRPLQLLGGKLLGIGLLVFAQAGLVVAFALGLGAAVGSNLLQGSGPAMVVSTLVWLVLGYAFYSWVYAAAGSLAERQDQVQAIALPIAIPMIVGYVLAIAAASTGSASTLLRVLGYLPPTAPFAMPVLVGLAAIAWWQVVLSGLISVVATVGVARLAAGVYQRSVLRTGRRVGLREALGLRRA